MKSQKRISKTILASLSLLCFQILYYQLTVVVLQWFAGLVPGWSNDCYLMVHHTFQFLCVFIPTLIIQRLGKADFGYHFKEWKKGLPWFWVGVLVELAISLIVGIAYGSWGGSISLDSIAFQLLFSGLGEEIVYRALPLAILSMVWGNPVKCKIGSSYEIDVDILISALLFSLGHISFQFGQSGIYFGWTQLITAFIMGIVLGKIYRKTNSVWICMLAHGIYNVIAITI